MNSGLEDVIAAETVLSHSDGERGILWVRGHTLPKLVVEHGYEGAAALLWDGFAGNDLTRASICAELGAAREIAFARPGLGSTRPPTGHRPRASGYASHSRPRTARLRQSWGPFRSRFPRSSGYARERRSCRPTPISIPPPTLLRILHGTPVTEVMAAALDTYFTSVIDNGLNASAFTARIIASTRASLVSAVHGAYSAFTGPLHGGAPGPMLDEAAASGDIEAWVEHKVAAGERLMGFGHRVFRHGDPRAEELPKALEHLGPGAGRLAFAAEVERVGCERLLCRFRSAAAKPFSSRIAPLHANSPRDGQPLQSCLESGARLPVRGSMRLSQYFLPLLRENPSEAQIVSHRLMLRAGMIRQSSAGIYSWLPLGLRVLKKVERIVREEQDRLGALEILMPTIQPAELWRESGRYEDYGKEMLRIRDRHDREMLYGPTNEEQVTEIVRASIKSYRDLPKILYHIQWKFRDEVRPRFGVMRGREFLMKDAYSFDLDSTAAKQSYQRMFAAYLRTFARMGLKAIPMQADPGPIGGELSHEFIILADAGESDVFFDRRWLETDIPIIEVDYRGDLEPIFQRWTAFYAATDEKHDPTSCPIRDTELLTARGLEVGHIFYFGDKYSRPMQALVTRPDGAAVPLQMGSYGIGVSRLPGALIEANHDDAGIIWPESVAPFRVGLINLRPADRRCRDAAEDLYGKLCGAGVEVLHDDRDESPGAKFATMDLIGLPDQLVIGPRGIAAGTVELKHRRTGERREISAEAALGLLTANASKL